MLCYSTRIPKYQLRLFVNNFTSLLQESHFTAVFYLQSNTARSSSSLAVVLNIGVMNRELGFDDLAALFFTRGFYVFRLDVHAFNDDLAGFGVDFGHFADFPLVSTSDDLNKVSRFDVHFHSDGLAIVIEGVVLPEFAGTLYFVI